MENNVPSTTGKMIKLPSGRKKFIHVNRNKINSNRKHGLNEPTITVKQGKENYYGHDVTVEGKVRLTQEEDQLSCGARVYIITHGTVTIIQNDEQICPRKIHQ